MAREETESQDAESARKYLKSVTEWCAALELATKFAASEEEECFENNNASLAENRDEAMMLVKFVAEDARARLANDGRSGWNLSDQMEIMSSNLKTAASLLHGQDIGYGQEWDDEEGEEATRKDTLYGWGDQIVEDGHIALEDKHRIKSVACNGQRGLYVSEAGDVFSIGDNGTGVPTPPTSAMEDITTPKVVGELVLERVLLGRRVVFVACGHLHSCALTQGGRLWSWGSGLYGRLGHGDENDQPVPRLCEALLSWHVRAVACGGAHTVAVVSPSRVFSWGRAMHGRLGLGDTRGTLSFNLPQLVDVDNHAHSATEAFHAFFGTKVPAAIQKSVDEPIISVACGWSFTLLLGASGTVRAFGAGKDGQCGLSPPKNQHYPVPLHNLSKHEVIQVSCGFHHAIAITLDGRVFTWGMGEEGQLGQGISQKSSHEPKLVCFPSDPDSDHQDPMDGGIKTAPPLKVHAVYAVAGQSHSLCAAERGGLWGWGSNIHKAIDPSLPREIIWAPIRVKVSEDINNINLKNNISSSSNKESRRRDKSTSGTEVIKHLGAGDHFTIAVHGLKPHSLDHAVADTSPPDQFHKDQDTQCAGLESGSQQRSPGHQRLKSDTLNMESPVVSSLGAMLQSRRISARNEMKAAASLVPQINTGSFCGGRIGVWSNGVYLARIVVLTSTGELEYYKELSSSDPDQIVTLHGHDIEILTKEGNVLEAWRTKPGQEYSLLLRLRFNSSTEAVVWAHHISRHSSADQQMHVSSEAAHPSKISLINGRKVAWRAAIGNQLRITPELYMIYKERATRQEGIGIDVRRTLPTLLLFGKRGEPLYEQLREVLEVYQCYRPDVGYVQGMSYIAAMLCLHMPNDPYECFVSLANLLASHHLFDFFRLGQAYNRLHLYYQVLDETISKTSSRLWQHLNRLGVLNEVHVACFQWLQTLFVRRLPLEQVTQLWDSFLCEKDTSVMFRACVAILVCMERGILSVSQPEDVMLLLRSSHQLKEVLKKTFTVVQVPYTTHEKLKALVRTN